MIYSKNYMRSFGYKHEGMLPIEEKLAYCLMIKHDLGVYGLRSNNTESLIELKSDLNDFELYGIEINEYNFKTILLEYTKSVDMVSYI